MAIYKCKMCGGDLEVTEGANITECEYCGTKQTVPTADNEKKVNLFNRANRLRLNNEFDKAASVYESIVAEFPEEAEAYWGLCLCNYGIEYVDDPVTSKKIPTCHRSSFDSLMDDSNFEMVMEYADAVSRKQYREEAKQIEEIRKGIIEVSSKEEPYDIFICYKETDDNGDRTVDSTIAQDVYDALTQKGYRVFFSRISLEDKLGIEYEPYIFAALNSAKIMLAFGTDYEYYNAVWVKNEWSRFLRLIASGQKKYLIPCYKNIDAYDMPKEFAKLQAQDMGKVGAIQDLVRGIDKLIGNPHEQTQPAQQASVTQVVGGPNVTALLKRVFMFLEDGDWKSADEYCEKVLDINPECAEAYVGKLMSELKVKSYQNLKDYPKTFDDRNNFKKAMRFADENFRNELQECIDFITNRNLTDNYNCSVQLMKNTTDIFELEKAARSFEELRDFKDSENLAKECKLKAKEMRYETAVSYMEHAVTVRDYKNAAQSFNEISEFKDSVKRVDFCLQKAEEMRIAEEREKAAHELKAKEMRYETAVSYMEHAVTEKDYKNAAQIFNEISEFKDSVKKADFCLQKAEERRIAEEREKAAHRLCSVNIVFTATSGAAQQLWFNWDNGEKETLCNGEISTFKLNLGKHRFNILNPFMKKSYIIDIQDDETIHVKGKSFSIKVDFNGQTVDY